MPLTTADRRRASNVVWLVAAGIFVASLAVTFTFLAFAGCTA
jgi:hypothetical protein